MHLILDTGPWVALHCKNDKHHAWAKAQFAQHTGRFSLVKRWWLKPVFLLARAGFDPSKALALIERGVVDVGLSLGKQAPAVRGLFERYDNVPASLAVACLVRMSELYNPCKVLTLDSDFHIYRRHGHGLIAVVSPPL